MPGGWLGGQRDVRLVVRRRVHLRGRLRHPPHALAVVELQQLPRGHGAGGSPWAQKYPASQLPAPVAAVAPRLASRGAPLGPRAVPCRSARRNTIFKNG